MKTIGRTLLAGAVCAAALGAGCLTTAAYVYKRQGLDNNIVRFLFSPRTRG